MLTKYENYIRKIWGALLIAAPILHAIFGPWKGIGGMVVGIGYSALFCYLLYCFSYKKPGVLLLIVTLVHSAITFFADVRMAAVEGLHELSALKLTFIIVWMVFCYLVYRINKKVRKDIHGPIIQARSRE